MTPAWPAPAADVGPARPTAGLAGPQPDRRSCPSASAGRAPAPVRRRRPLVGAAARPVPPPAGGATPLDAWTTAAPPSAPPGPPPAWGAPPPVAPSVPPVGSGWTSPPPGAGSAWPPGPPGPPPAGAYGYAAGPPGSYPPAPTPRRTKPWIVALAVLAVLLIGATVVTFAATRNTGTSYPKAWDSRILPIVRFDEQERGLTFKHPVQVLYLSPKAFDKTVTTSSATLSAKDKAQINSQEAGLRAIGLIDGKVDLFKQENDLSSGGILAYYDPKDQKVRVKGTVLTPDVRVTLAHELTHALQDQYFGLKREDSLADDPQTAFRSVVEGDAVVVQNAYADTMSQKDQAAYHKAEDDGADQAYSGIPDALVAQQAEPYIIGPAFVELLKDRGGNEAIDQAIKNPPASTAALMNAYKYLAQPSTPTTPTTLAPFKLAAGQKRADDGDNTFGALTWYLMLARRLDVHDAIKAVDDWSADTALGYQDKSGRVCVELEYKASSAGGATTMRAAAREVEGGRAQHRRHHHRQGQRHGRAGHLRSRPIGATDRDRPLERRRQRDRGPHRDRRSVRQGPLLGPAGRVRQQRDDRPPLHRRHQRRQPRGRGEGSGRRRRRGQRLPLTDTGRRRMIRRDPFRTRAPGPWPRAGCRGPGT